MRYQEVLLLVYWRVFEVLGLVFILWIGIGPLWLLARYYLSPGMRQYLLGEDDSPKAIHPRWYSRWYRTCQAPFVSLFGPMIDRVCKHVCDVRRYNGLDR